VRVVDGKLVGTAPEGLPEGTELELCVADSGPAMSEAELAKLNAALEAAWESIQAGRARPAADVIRDLRSRRPRDL
jgi:hypothetical protein